MEVVDYAQYDLRMFEALGNVCLLNVHQTLVLREIGIHTTMCYRAEKLVYMYCNECILKQIESIAYEEHAPPLQL